MYLIPQGSCLFLHNASFLSQRLGSRGGTFRFLHCTRSACSRSRSSSGFFSSTAAALVVAFVVNVSMMKRQYHSTQTRKENVVGSEHKQRVSVKYGAQDTGYVFPDQNGDKLRSRRCPSSASLWFLDPLETSSGWLVLCVDLL